MHGSNSTLSYCYSSTDIQMQNLEVLKVFMKFKVLFREAQCQKPFLNILCIHLTNIHINSFDLWQIFQNLDYSCHSRTSNYVKLEENL